MGQGAEEWIAPPRERLNLGARRRAHRASKSPTRVQCLGTLPCRRSRRRCYECEHTATDRSTNRLANGGLVLRICKASRGPVAPFNCQSLGRGASEGGIQLACLRSDPVDGQEIASSQLGGCWGYLYRVLS